jgi:hypothetical protein
MMSQLIKKGSGRRCVTVIAEGREVM